MQINLVDVDVVAYVVVVNGNYVLLKDHQVS